jgi:hypothetical protein
VIDTYWRTRGFCSQAQKVDATEFGLTAKTIVSAVAIRAARRSFQGSPGATSSLSRKASKPSLASNSTSIWKNAASLRELGDKDLGAIIGRGRDAGFLATSLATNKSEISGLSILQGGSSFGLTLTGAQIGATGSLRA